MSMARTMFSSGRGTEVREAALIAAHCEACQAMADFADAGEKELAREAADLSYIIAEALLREPRRNPGLKRYKDLSSATRDADRRALRTQNPHFVYRLKSKPQFAVLPKNHPIQYSIESGALAMGDAKLVHQTNPVDPASAPPRFLQGYPADTEWEYKGRQIRVKEMKVRPHLTPKQGTEWIASWSEPTDEGDTWTASAFDQQGALANARHKIDVEVLGLWYPESLIHHAVDSLDEMGQQISRSSVARYIELASRGSAHLPWGPENTAEAVQRFNALPLQERLRLIDEVIDYQLRAGLLDPENVKLTKNPTRKRPRGRSVFRRLMRL